MRTPAWLRECGVSDSDLARIERGEMQSGQKYHVLNEKLKRAIAAGVKQLMKDVLRAAIVLLITIQLLSAIDKRVMRL